MTANSFPYIWHVDLATLSRREVYRDDLDPQAIIIARGVLARVVAQPGNILPAPAMPDAFFCGRSGGRCVTIALLEGATLVQTMAIAATARCGAQAWRDLHREASVPVRTAAERPPRAPWCATLIAPDYPRIVTDAIGHMMTAAMGSVFAWAWLDYLEARHATTDRDA